MLGFELNFDYDPVTYTYTMLLQIPSYWETLAGYGLGDENPLGDNVPYKEAKALYEKFSADGYSGVSCRVLIHNSANEILDEGSYSNGNSSPSMDGGQPSYSADDFPPTVPPIDPNDPDAVLYSDELGQYLNENGIVLEIAVATGGGINYYANIYANQSDVNNHAEPFARELKLIRSIKKTCKASANTHPSCFPLTDGSFTNEISGPLCCYTLRSKVSCIATMTMRMTSKYTGSRAALIWAAMSPNRGGIKQVPM